MPNKYLSETINNIISIARLAPSVHNTQPWTVKVMGNDLNIQLEPSRQLTHGDPTGRQSYISLGIFTESCVVALEHFDYKAKKVNIDKTGNIKIETAVAGGRSPDNHADVEALKNRFTDRSIYRKTSIDDRQILEIENAWSQKGVAIKVSTDPEILKKCAHLTQHGLLLALTSEDFRKELVEYLVPDSNSPQGISLDSLQGGKVSKLLVRKLMASGLSRKREAQLEYKRWDSASALVFVLADGDSIPYWVESGRAYLRASLAIQKLGLAQATSAAIVEASDFHEDVEKLLGTSMRIECLMRVGLSKAKRQASGRLEPKDLITT